MLLNYNGTMDAVFTLAHELGHTLHSMYSTKYQPYATNDYTIFVAEVASTFNERLLLDYMLKNTNDHKEKIALIEEAIGNIMGTYYIQALFAAYEYEAHKLTEEGNPITPDVLSEIMTKLFAEYFGDSLVMDELQKIIWARIPHSLILHIMYINMQQVLLHHQDYMKKLQMKNILLKREKKLVKNTLNF